MAYICYVIPGIVDNFVTKMVLTSTVSILFLEYLTVLQLKMLSYGKITSYGKFFFALAPVRVGRVSLPLTSQYPLHRCPRVFGNDWRTAPESCGVRKSDKIVSKSFYGEEIK